MAHLCGLGYLAKPENIKKTLSSIARYNYVESFGDHFNNMRSYALGNESGLSVTAYPDPEKRPDVPLSYFAEAWSGLEYTAAAGMIYEGMQAEALKTIQDVRKRYDGNKRSPFNEEECGNHYARAMASWASIIAYSEFSYSGIDGSLIITSKPGNYFWSNGYSWGNALVAEEGGKVKVTLEVYHGSIKLSSVTAADMVAVPGVKAKGTSTIKNPVVLKEGSKQEFIIQTKK
jgi:non-lysosomal glucosylceramidase